MTKKLVQVESKHQHNRFELVQSEKKSRAWLDKSPVCTMILDLDFNLQYMSSAGVEALNINDITLFYGKPYPFDFYPESFKTKMTANLNKALETNEVIEQEAPVVDVDGKELWFQSTIVPVDDEEGQHDYIIVISIEITERKQAEEALNESEEKYRTLFEHSADAILIIEGDKFVDCNPATVKMLGYKNKEELLETHPSQSSPERQPDGRKSFEKANEFMSIAFTQGSHCFEWEHKRKNGEVFLVEVLLTAIPFGERKVLHVVWRDITDRKFAEEELGKSHALYAQAEEMGKLGYWEWDSINSKLVSCSEQYAKLFEMTVDEALVFFSSLENDMESVHPDDLERYKQHMLDNEEQRTGVNIEYRIITKTGKVVYVRELGEPVLDDHGTLIRTIGTLQDISEHKQIEEQLSFQASHDALTGLVNRLEFERRSERLLSTIGQDKAEHALCFMDLDQFKVVNDTCGHTAGDELLRQLSKVLNHEVRKRDTLARLGGDEFGVLMEHCSLEHAKRVARTLQKAVQDYQFSWEEHTFKIGVSIGLVAITETTPGLSELMKQADAACYMAKDMGRNRIHVYHDEDETLAQRHGEMQWVTRIHKALEEDKFCLYAQPIVPLDSRTDIHYELLIRMKGEKGELIPPGAFLPAAERYNLMAQLDHWVIKSAFALLIENPRFLEQINFISINLSGQSLTENNVLDFIIMQLDESGIDGTKICFEITETAAISNLSTATKFISTLKGLGCRFALDDFGSGLSSFGYLKNLSVDYLKIDGMFVKDIVDDPIDRAMVKSINEIGQVMGMQTIAEFVENDEIKDMLREIGVNYAQGYGIGKPQPFDKLLGRSSNLTNINLPKDDDVES